MTASLAVQAFFDPATFTVTYLVHDPSTKVAAIVDPVLDYDPRNARTSTSSADAVLAEIEAQGLELAWLLETHAHADHLSAAHYLRAKTGAPVVIGSRIVDVLRTFVPLFAANDAPLDGVQFDRLVSDGETLPLGSMEIRVLHTPGHTPACVTYHVGDAAFVGDTLFMPDYGTARSDFPGGSAEQLYRSIRRILELPAATRIFVGHDYLPAGRSEYRWETTVGEQRAENVHIHDGICEEAFVALRNERDAKLAPPVLILPALQVNVRAGALPPAEENGIRYLRLPLNML
ncbi:MBL fold metallo-hydrolase [Novosphingobium huizhouense]|uniref:MBL fold metallo-hydrolase n=1 Tax=Novosphingobium huizhouense TaxID=2866625 RepID=UPI001CD8C624|nr:MBL fold metallo-hydrolase [Novosphingobium huizhouense]